MDTIANNRIYGEVFSMGDIEFRVKQLTSGKAKGIKWYQDKSFRIRGLIFIPHTQNIFNLVVNIDFPKTWMEILIIPILKIRDKSKGTPIIVPLSFTPF